MSTVIEVQNLHKRYGDHVAVDDISFSVQQGEIFGIIGPNGAGKTTTVESIMGLRKPDGGTVRVLGADPQQNREAVVQRIGIQLQEANLPERLKVWEAIDLMATFYEQTVPWEPLLAEWGIADKKNTMFGQLSGGQKQRLFIAAALVNDPEIVFLDELTTGLDPQARRATWEMVRAIRDAGKTVVLVTHFMDEAEALCDRIAIIDSGRVVALDTPAQLIAQTAQGTRIHFTNVNGYDAQQLRNLSAVSRVDMAGRQVTVHGDGPLLAQVAVALAEAEITPRDLRLEQADLEDVFIALTGHGLRA
ncbi:MAG: ABC transporter ATP-binding protein [Ardenticatenales bacterium]|nr:ABC transporter ATP-binding protein [Ardenticatenales bacterium]